MTTNFFQYVQGNPIEIWSTFIFSGIGGNGFFINSEMASIPDVEKKRARERFEDLGYDENILLVRYDTGWFSDDWMSVITDKYIRHSDSYSSEPFCASWDIFSGFFYQDGNIVARYKNEEEYDFTWLFHFPAQCSPQSMELLANALNGIAKSYISEKSSWDIVREKWNELMGGEYTDEDMKSFSDMAFEMQKKEKISEKETSILLKYLLL